MALPWQQCFCSGPQNVFVIFGGLKVGWDLAICAALIRPAGLVKNHAVLTMQMVAKNTLRIWSELNVS